MDGTLDARSKLASLARVELELVVFRRSGLLIFAILGLSASVFAPPDLPPTTLAGRVELLDRAFNRLVKGIQFNDANPFNWDAEDWTELGSDQQWREALEVWTTQNPSVGEAIEAGLLLRDNFDSILEDQLRKDLGQYSAIQWDLPEKTLKSFEAFLKSQRRWGEVLRPEAQADQMARQGVMDSLRGLPIDRQFPQARWKSEDPASYFRYARLRTRYEQQDTSQYVQRARKESFAQWKADALRLVDESIIQNIRTALLVNGSTRPRPFLNPLPVANYGSTDSTLLTEKGMTHIPLEFDSDGRLMGSNTHEYLFWFDRRPITRQHHPDGSNISMSPSPEKNSTRAHLVTLWHWNHELLGVRNALLNAKFDDPRLRLMTELGNRATEGRRRQQSPLVRERLVAVHAPKPIQEALNALHIHKLKDAWAFDLNEPFNYPLAPTASEIVRHDDASWRKRVKKTIREAAKNTALVSALTAAIIGIPVGTVKVLNMQGSHSPNSYTSPRTPDPSNSEAGNGDQSVLFLEMRGSGPRRYEIPYLEDPKFENSTPWEPDSSGQNIPLKVTANLPIPVSLMNGEVALLTPEGFKLAELKVERWRGNHALERGKDYSVDSTDDGQYKLTIHGFWNRYKGNIDITMSYTPHEQTLDPNIYAEYFSDLDKSKVRTIVAVMEEAGLTEAAKSIRDELAHSSKIDVRTIEAAIKAGAIYSQRPEGDPKVSQSNPFWLVSKAVHSDGLIHGDCDMVNEANAVFFELYFKDTPEILVERGALFHKDPASFFLRTGDLHGQVYLRPRNSVGKVILDSTPSLRESETEPPSKSSTPQEKPPPVDLSQETKGDPYYHKFRFRGGLLEEWEESLGSKPLIRIRKRIRDRNSQEQLVAGEESNQLLLRALEQVQPKHLEASMPFHAVGEILEGLSEYLEENISEDALKTIALRWVSRQRRNPHASLSEILQAVYDSQRETLEALTLKSQDKILKSQYLFLTDPGLQRLILGPLQDIAQTQWKPATWQEEAVSRNEYVRLRSCKREIERLVGAD